MGILVVGCIISYLNRQVVAIVLGPMKVDLGLNDSEISLLYSTFAVSYALAALPLGRIADTYNRKWLVTAGMVVWSVMSVVSGITRQYALIFLARIGLGMGEAVLSPATNSIAGDLFPREKIPLALSVFQTGAIMGTAVAFVLGGAALGFMEGLSHHDLPLVGSSLKPWQLTFIVVSLPGFVLAAIMLLVREPIRRNLAGVSAPEKKGVPLHEIWAFYKRNWQTLVFHHFGFLAFSLAGFAYVFWSIPFFTRVHHMDAATASQIFGWIFVFFGPAGVVWAGMLAGRFARRGRRDANILAGLVGGAATIPVLIVLQVVPTFWAFVLCAPALFFVNSPFGLAYGALPVITPPPMRAQVAAVYMLIISGGMAFGPVIAGIFNDRLFPGDQGVRYSMMTLTAICGVVGIGCLMACRKYYARSLDEADALEAAAIP
jgi:MFS family permease